MVGLLWNDGIIQCTLGTILFNISGHTTTGVNTITLKCAPGESIYDQVAIPLAADSTKGVTIRGAASGGPTSVSYVWVSDDNVTIEGIQFIDPYAAGLSQMVIVFADNFQLRRSIIDGYSSSTSGASLLDLSTGTLTYTVANSLFIDRAVSAVNFGILSSGATTAGKIVNNTFISLSTSSAAVQVTGATAANAVVMKNCGAFGQTGPTNSNNAGALGIDHCVFSSASPYSFGATDNGNNLLSKTAANQFVSSTTDFHLLVGADCRSTGVVDTTDIPDSVDFFGTNRGATWDVGCNQYSAASMAARCFFG